MVALDSYGPGSLASDVKQERNNQWQLVCWGRVGKVVSLDKAHQLFRLNLL